MSEKLTEQIQINTSKLVRSNEGFSEVINSNTQNNQLFSNVKEKGLSGIVSANGQNNSDSKDNSEK